MKINQLRKNKQKGFALLFTIVIVSAVSVITAGLTNAIYKQMILSSLAKDSQAAFYQADTASDCALYADLKKVSPTDSTFLTYYSTNDWSCGGLDLKVVIANGDISGSYSLVPDVADDYGEPCFRIDVKKSSSIDINSGKTIVNTTIKAKGYNIWDKENPRTVEREIQIDYSG